MCLPDETPRGQRPNQEVPGAILSSHVSPSRRRRTPILRPSERSPALVFRGVGHVVPALRSRAVGVHSPHRGVCASRSASAARSTILCDIRWNVGGDAYLTCEFMRRGLDHGENDLAGGTTATRAETQRARMRSHRLGRELYRTRVCSFSWSSSSSGNRCDALDACDLRSAAAGGDGRASLGTTSWLRQEAP